MPDIKRYLEKRKPLIDRILEKYIPRRMSPEYIEWAFGKPRYSYDVETLNNSLSDPIWDFLDRGGKRWRPALFLLISEALGADIEKIKNLLVIPESIHNGTIMVDDVEDCGELRRGKPCTHIKYGTDIAINTGNYLYFIPLLSVRDSMNVLTKEQAVRIYEAYIQEMINVSAGQAMDIWWHKGNSFPTEEHYLQMCAYKTGTLARLSARLAAIASGRDEETEKRLGAFAESIGVAFQIQDDVLDVISSGKEREAFGKSFGNDIKEGKRTLMVIHCLNHAKKEDTETLLDILNSHTSDPKRIKEAISLLHKTGSVEYAKSKAREIVLRSWKDVESTLPDSEAKRTLKSFADFLIERKY